MKNFLYWPFHALLMTSLPFVIAAAGLYARLLIGPMELPFLVPVLEQRLTHTDHPVHITGIQLRLLSHQRLPRLHLYGVFLENQDAKHHPLQIDSIDIVPQWSNLLIENPRVGFRKAYRIEIDAMRLSLTPNLLGTQHANEHSDPADTQNRKLADPPPPSWRWSRGLRRLLERPFPGSEIPDLSALSRIFAGAESLIVRRAEIVLEESPPWAEVHVSLRKGEENPEQLRIEISALSPDGNIDPKGLRIHFSLRAPEADSPRISLEGEFRNARISLPKDRKTDFPTPNVQTHATIAQGTFHLHFSPAGDFSLTLAAPQLQAEWSAPVSAERPLASDSASAQASDATVRIDEARLTVHRDGSPETPVHIQAEFSLQSRQPGLDPALTLTSTAFPPGPEPMWLFSVAVQATDTVVGTKWTDLLMQRIDEPLSISQGILSTWQISLPRFSWPVSGKSWESLEARTTFSDLTLSWKQVPVLSGASGILSLTQGNGSLQIEDGLAMGLRVRDVSLDFPALRFSPLSVDTGGASLRGEAQGDIAVFRDRVAELVHPSSAPWWSFLRKVAQGRTHTRIALSIPDVHAPSSWQGTLQGELEDGRLSRIYAQRDAGNVRAVYEVHPEGIRIEGHATFAEKDVAFAMSYRHPDPRSDDSQESSVQDAFMQLHLHAPRIHQDWLLDVHADSSSPLALKEYLPVLDGPFEMDVLYRAYANGHREVHVEFDLTETAFTLPFPQWRKKSGVAVTCRIDLRFSGRGLESIPSFSLLGPRLHIAGAQKEPPDEQTTTFSFRRYQVQDIDLRNIIVQMKRSPRQSTQRALHIDIGGGRLQLRTEKGYIWGMIASGTQRSFPMRIQAKDLEYLSLSEGSGLHGARFLYVRNAEGVTQELHFSGRIPREDVQGDRIRTSSDDRDSAAFASFDYTLSSMRAPGRIDIASNNFGGLLRSLRLLEGVHGGEVSLSLTQPRKTVQVAREGVSQSLPPDAEAAGVQDPPFSGSIHAKNFSVTDMPAFAELLNFVFITGASETLAGKGVVFHRMEGDLLLQDLIVSVKNVRALGIGLGLTVEGDIDLRRKNMELRGSLFPAYAINRLLGKLPLLGPVLAGGEDHGVFGVAYGISGSFRKPEIFVNPISSLTPGFLREIFQDIIPTKTSTETPNKTP